MGSPSLLSRVLARVDQNGPVPSYRPDLGPCWLWTGAPRRDGYGEIRVEGAAKLAHRVTYALFVGEIPAGLQVDHLCRVRKCVRPTHLEPVTQAVNIARGVEAKTHCKQGHEFSAANTYRWAADPRRTCRACNREAARRLRERRKAAA